MRHRGTGTGAFSYGYVLGPYLFTVTGARAFGL